LRTAVGRSVSVPFRYRYAYNGFAVELTDTEANVLRGLSGVANVRQDYTRELLTDVGPAWIGAPSVWSGASTGGVRATKGEGVVVGIIDTGINHDHPSFADVGGDNYDHSNPRGHFYGLCDPVLGMPFCNDKLIGVWDFTGTSPEDDNQHGSHTASTAAGNVLKATLNAPTISIEKNISGVAPHANLITYKACIAAGCLGASLTAAIDQATKDVVDVINYSIGGGPTDPWDDPDAESFLAARDAGIFVSVSAGNDGSRAGTVGSPANAPWVLSVGASTHNRALTNSLTSMAGGSTTPPANIKGASLTAGYGPAPIVHAADKGDRQCLQPFAPGTFDGEIVVCERGVNPRVEKGRNVELGGAGGMVLANSAAEGESTVGDAHELPAVAIGYADAQVLEAWLGTGSGHTATIAGTTFDLSASNGDVMAGFSSRGPNKTATDVLKPDISGPGVDILAATHTTNPAAPAEFGVLSGTSMSAPHLTGSAALVRAVHRDWTPAEVQSALMTTALNTTMRKEDGVRPADAFDMGAGRVDLTKAALAGFVLDEDAQAFADANPSAGGDPTALNLASLTNADCDGDCTWTRTIRSTLGTEATWSAKTSGPRTLGLSVSPSRFTLAPGATQVLTVTAGVKKLPVGKYVFGQLDLTSSSAPDAHLPIVILPGGAPDPVTITATDTTGSATVQYTSPLAIKTLTSRVYGLTQGVAESIILEQDPTPLDPYDLQDEDLDVGTYVKFLDVPAGSRVIAAQIDATTAPDIDLYVGLDTNGDGIADPSEEICKSASSGSAESCSLPNPDAGRYWILIQNWAGGVSPVDYVASVVPGTNEGNLTVSGPVSAAAETPFNLTFNWNEPDLSAGEHWFALVELGTDAKNPANVGSMFVKIARTG
jgi:subtilisin family serine protease